MPRVYGTEYIRYRIRSGHGLKPTQAAPRMPTAETAKRENPAEVPAPVVDERLVRAEVTAEHVVFHLADGRIVHLPLTWSWRLLEATEEERQAFETDGYGIHWEAVDEDLSVRGALRGMPAPRPGSRPGLRAEMETRYATLEGRFTPGAIKQLRRRMDLTQSEFAERLGVRQATISAWETGSQDPSPMALRLLATFDAEAG